MYKDLPFEGKHLELGFAEIERKTYVRIKMENNLVFLGICVKRLHESAGNG